MIIELNEKQKASVESIVAKSKLFSSWIAQSENIDGRIMALADKATTDPTEELLETLVELHARREALGVLYRQAHLYDHARINFVSELRSVLQKPIGEAFDRLTNELKTSCENDEKLAAENGFEISDGNRTRELKNSLAVLESIASSKNSTHRPTPQSICQRLGIKLAS